MKNSLYGINIRWEIAEEKINKFEGIAIETLQKEAHWEKRIQTENRVRYINIWINIWKILNLAIDQKEANEYVTTSNLILLSKNDTTR